MIRTLTLASALAIAAIAAPAIAAGPFDAALAGAWRSDANKARDQYRHPAQTLKFFGVKPTDTVVEISPAGGWYTEVIAPSLKGKGQYVAAHNNPLASMGAAKSVETFKVKFADKAVFGDIKVTAFGKDAYDIAPPASADVVLSFRNVHNWHMGGFDQAAFDAFFKALKPGGTLGIVEHRLPEDRPDAAMKTSGYMKVSYVKALAEKAGFKFVGASEVNANAKDTKDYPKGVWTLPPNYAEGDTDKARYAAIGESDRMTLKFVKPKK